MEARLGSRQYAVALVGLVVVLFAVLSMLAPNTFPTVRNIVSMASQMAPLGLLALCVCMTFLIGGIDLSIVAVANASAIAAALTANALEPTLGGMGASLVGVASCLAIGLITGLINGVLVSRLRVHPIPITLGTMALFTGIATGVTGGATQFGTGSLSFLGLGTLARIPVPFILFVVAAVVLSFITLRTRFGFGMYAVGASEKVARFARLDVSQIQVRTYVLSGVIASIAGLVMFSSTNAASVSFGSSFLIQAILIAVLSGVDPYGGRGRIMLIIFAVAAMQLVQTGINMALGRWEGASFAAEFAWGVLLILVLGLNRRLGKSQRRQLRQQDVEMTDDDEPEDVAPSLEPR